MLFAAADPFADAAEGDDSGKDYVHIRVQQRNGKKSLTTIQVQLALPH
jgi:translation initiation factor 1